MREKSFSKLCYELLKKIPKGKVTTYKEIARALGTKGYRAVGQILKKNTNPNEIPCFKVVRSDGNIGGYCGSMNKTEEKINKLKLDGIIVNNGKIDLNRYMYKF